PLDLPDDFGRRIVAFDAQPVSRRIDRTRAADELSARGGLADISRAEIERLARRVDANRIQKTAAQYFHSGDAAFFRWNELLHQCGVIRSQLERARRCSRRELRRGVEPLYAGTTATHVRLHDHGKLELSGGGGRVGGIVDDTSRGV